MAGLDEPVRASSVEIKPVIWLWRERVPRKMITIFGGRRDQGKGLGCVHIAAEVSNSTYVGKDGKERPGYVIYSAAEDAHEEMTAPRLKAAGANLDNIDLWRFRLPKDHEKLAKLLLQIDQPREVDLVVMDPIASHLSGNISRHSDNIRTVTEPLTRLLEATGTACIVVEHVLKKVPSSGHPIDAIGGGSSGLIAAARMAFLLGIDPKDDERRFLCCVKHNVRDKPMEIAFEMDLVDVPPAGDMPALMFDEECTFNPMKFLVITHGNRVGRPPDKRAAACEWLANYLWEAYYKGLPALANEPAIPPGPVLAARAYEDGKQLQISTKTLKRASQDMEIVKDPPTGAGTKWSLPDELKQLLDGGERNREGRADLGAERSG